MQKIVIYSFRGRYYIYPLGCCTDHQTLDDIFVTGEEEEVLTITPEPYTSPLDTLRQLIAEIDKRNITEVEGLTIILHNELGEETTLRSRETVH